MPVSFKQSDLLGDTPAPIQAQILACKEFELGLITGFAAGKTRGIIAAAIQHAVQNPNAKVLIGRKTYPEMVNTVKQPFFSIADKLHRAGWFVRPGKWDYKEGTHLARLVNGSQFFFSNLDDPIKFRNEEYSMIIADQAEELSEELWEILIARIRHSPVNSDNWQAIAAANDNGHNWVWRRFVDVPRRLLADPERCQVHPFCVFKAGHPDEDGNYRNIPCSTRRFFHGTTLDNRHNLSPRYLSTLLSHPKEWQRHFIYATMEGGSGRLLPDPAIVSHFDPPAYWPRYRAIDHALNSPCCCLWITINTDQAPVNGIPPGSAYVYKEYWAGNSSIDQHAQRILALSKGEQFMATVMDASAFHATQSGKEGIRFSFADLYAEEGLPCSPSTRDPFARVERINICHNRGMKVSERCEHLIRTMPEYYGDQSKTDGTFKILNKSEFHAVDALGYGLMIIPMDPRQPFEGEPKPDYLKKPMDTMNRIHHEHEWKRIAAVQEANQELSHPGLKNIKVTEFWGEGEDVVPEYDPFFSNA